MSNRDYNMDFTLTLTDHSGSELPDIVVRRAASDNGALLDFLATVRVGERFHLNNVTIHLPPVAITVHGMQRMVDVDPVFISELIGEIESIVRMYDPTDGTNMVLIEVARAWLLHRQSNG